MEKELIVVICEEQNKPDNMYLWSCIHCFFSQLIDKLGLSTCKNQLHIIRHRAELCVLLFLILMHTECPAQLICADANEESE